MDNQFDLVEELSIKFIFGYLISIECHNVTYLITPLFWGCFDYRFKAFVEELFFHWSIKCFCRVLSNVSCEAVHYVYVEVKTVKWKLSDFLVQILELLNLPIERHMQFKVILALSLFSKLWLKICFFCCFIAYVDLM